MAAGTAPVKREFDRVILITLDGLGVGALPDAARFGDQQAATLQHILSRRPLCLPHLEALGLLRILEPQKQHDQNDPLSIVGAYGRMAEQSIGKDSTVGHWELAGLVQRQALPTFPQGFPETILRQLEQQTAVQFLGNVAASGTTIIQQLGDAHCRSGRPILYTSVDSVMQIAAHEAIIPLPELYELCRAARQVANRHRIGRVIARPFIGSSAADYARTRHRRDFSLPPTGETVLDLLVDGGYEVLGVGKIHDLFAGRGVSHRVKTESNAAGVKAILDGLGCLKKGLVFANLIDFDMLYGHRRDVDGFGRALEAFDEMLPLIQRRMEPKDLLIITADHGCDPTMPGSDHTREYVPLLVWHQRMRHAMNLGTRSSFADVAATIAENFSLRFAQTQSFLPQLLEG